MVTMKEELYPMKKIKIFGFLLRRSVKDRLLPCPSFHNLHCADFEQSSFYCHWAELPVMFRISLFSHLVLPKPFPTAAIVNFVGLTSITIEP
jgi:hypothetical protein